jgi:hypothetical protein
MLSELFVLNIGKRTSMLAVTGGGPASEVVGWRGEVRLEGRGGRGFSGDQQAAEEVEVEKELREEGTGRRGRIGGTGLRWEVGVVWKVGEAEVDGEKEVCLGLRREALGVTSRGESGLLFRKWVGVEGFEVGKREVEERGEQYLSIGGSTFVSDAGSVGKQA